MLQFAEAVVDIMPSLLGRVEFQIADTGGVELGAKTDDPFIVDDGTAYDPLACAAACLRVPVGTLEIALTTTSVTAKLSADRDTGCPRTIVSPVTTYENCGMFCCVFRKLHGGQ